LASTLEVFVVKFKIVLIMLMALLAPLSSFADEYPMEWRVRDEGFTNCSFGIVFNKKMDCGEECIQLFECDTKKDNKLTRVQLVGLGSVKSDVANQCSPTVRIHKFIEQKE
jgi:hypothetical protein